QDCEMRGEEFAGVRTPGPLGGGRGMRTGGPHSGNICSAVSTVQQPWRAPISISHRGRGKECGEFWAHDDQDMRAQNGWSLMRLRVWREVTDLAQQELAAMGFHRWSRSIYNIGLNAEAEGMVLLGRVYERGRLPDVYVQVSMGVRNQAIESVLNEIVGEKRRR